MELSISIKVFHFQSLKKIRNTTRKELWVLAKAPRDSPTIPCEMT